MIPSGTRFIGISESVNLTERKSAGINAETQPYTIEDITSTVKPYKVFTALLTQSGGNGATGMNWDDGTGNPPLTIGVTYEINISAGMDMTNVGAPNNDIGTFFIATGTTPNSWGEGSLLYNTGAPVVTVLENTIGNVWWTYATYGTYEIWSDVFNPLFPISKTYTSVNSIGQPGGGANPYPFAVTGINNNGVNITVQVGAGDEPGFNGLLNNTPIEIRVYN